MRSTPAGRLYSHLANEWDTTGPGQSPAQDIFSNIWRNRQGAGQMHLSTNLLLNFHSLITKIYGLLQLIIKRPLRDACLCMGDLQAPAAPQAPHFVFLITL